MAKKNTESPQSPSPAPRRPRQPRRTAARPAAAPLDVAGVSGVEPIDTAADADEGRGAAPPHDDIAVAAYHRYLKRRGHGGSDVDDWVEAERELRSRSR